MQRYDGRDLGASPHIAILGSCKLGNFIVTIPMLRILRNKYPGAVIDFWGSEITKDFELALCGKNQPLDWRKSWDKKYSEIKEIFNSFTDRTRRYSNYDLLINCDGFNPFTQALSCLFKPKYLAGAGLREDGRSLLEWGLLPNQRFLADKDWDSIEFIKRYSEFFKSNYIAELLCRMVFLNPSADDLALIDLPWEEPGFDVPEILIHCTTARSAKIWPFDNWREVLAFCQTEQIKVGLIGASPQIQASEYHSQGGEDSLIKNFPSILTDLRGKTNLIQLAGACKLARGTISVDAGPMHVSAGVGSKTLAIVGNDKHGDGVSPIRLWLPRTKFCERTISDYSTTSFADNNYRNDNLMIAKKCMNGVPPSQIIDWIKSL
jgi:ADP-heptose:LPS heptosyltransferase|tara:strand:- start:446 stop:1576 length:1131 start_codon:yes stop_codon:yes gene_type:complete